MNTTDALRSELDSATASYDHYAAEYSKFVVFKQEIEAALSQLNVVGDNGVRLSVVDWERWRQKKIREKLSIDKRLSNLKATRHYWSEECRRLKLLLKDHDVSTQQEAQLQETQEQLRLAQRDNEQLRQRIRELDSQYMTLERQYDAVIRQLNAIPRTLRGESVS